MNIPPQLYNVLQRGLSIETCPSCHRIIYWEDLMKGDPQS
ncbi:MAG TPA: C4-type zinc ribbon domain-containing protein [Polyangia bacterium]|nr:C4-type zinc ribbon domain-containing protein [Polyangia bacterium]